MVAEHSTKPVGFSGVRRPLETLIVIPSSSQLPRDTEQYQELAGPPLHIVEIVDDLRDYVEEVEFLDLGGQPTEAGGVLRLGWDSTSYLVPISVLTHR